MNNQLLTECDPYRRLSEHHLLLSQLTISQLFAADPDRAKQFCLQTEDIYLDYSKNLLTTETMQHLFTLADSRDLIANRDAMFAGETLNNTEQRAVLHTLLRVPATADAPHPYHKAVIGELQKMQVLCERFESGNWRGFTGKKLHQIIVIGIGGSYLGPKLACEALVGFRQADVQVHFVANVDAHELSDVLSRVNPEEALVVVISKSFTTQETSVNAKSAAAWLCTAAKTHDVLAQQFVAISANLDAVNAFGIPDQHVLTMWDWVGGRYSLWSTVGFPVALQIGFENFQQLLAGAYAMDRHFCTAPMEQNLPVVLALTGIWHINFCGYPHYAVLPYDHRLRSLPGYLQQLDMESNGKSVTRSGQPVDYKTGPVLFGEAGTNGQHAFYQLIHQGTSIVPCDFIGSVAADHQYPNQHRILLANMVAQSQALMQGRTIESTRRVLAQKGLSEQQVDSLAPHMTFTGNRPSNTLVIKALNPKTLGALLALYEHKIFVQGILWDINSFDQMGVELGKILANELLPGFSGEPLPTSCDSSTRRLLHLLTSGPD